MSKPGTLNPGNNDFPDAWPCGCESMGYEASGPSLSGQNFLAGITTVDLPGPQTCTSHNQGDVFARGLLSVSYDGSDSAPSAPVYLNGFQASRYTGATTGEGADSASPYYSPRTLDVYPQGFPVETPGLSPSGFGPNTPASTLIITPGSGMSGNLPFPTPSLTDPLPLLDQGYKIDTNENGESPFSTGVDTQQAHKDQFSAQPGTDAHTSLLFQKSSHGQASEQGVRLDVLDSELSLYQLPSESQEDHLPDFTYPFPPPNQPSSIVNEIHHTSLYEAPIAGSATSQAPPRAQYTDDHFISRATVGELHPAFSIELMLALMGFLGAQNDAQRPAEGTWSMERNQHNPDGRGNPTGVLLEPLIPFMDPSTVSVGGTSAVGYGSEILVPSRRPKEIGASAAHQAAVEKKRKHDRKHFCPFRDCKSPGFTTKQNLIDHKKSHLGSDRHRCLDCDKDYGHLPSLSRHIREKHKVSTKKRKKDQSTQ